MMTTLKVVRIFPLIRILNDSITRTWARCRGDVKDNNCKDAPNHAGDFTTVAPTEGQQSLELDLSQCWHLVLPGLGAEAAGSVQRSDWHKANSAPFCTAKWEQSPAWEVKEYYILVLNSTVICSFLHTGGPMYPFPRIWACASRDVTISRGYSVFWLVATFVRIQKLFRNPCAFQCWNGLLVILSRHLAPTRFVSSSDSSIWYVVQITLHVVNPRA